MNVRPVQDQRPIGFFVHHQGRGHAKRCEALIGQMGARPITIFTADRSLFVIDRPNVTFVDLPNMIGAAPATEALHRQPAPEGLHCVPLGVHETTETMGAIVEWARTERPALLVVDVSAEIAILARIISVPCVSIRMHGDRNDPGHDLAHDASVGILAPFHPSLELKDWPDALKAKTFYTGGLCTTLQPVPDQRTARKTLGLPEHGEIVLALSGAGGGGMPFAPLTVGARARRGALWLTAGRISREGHETEFGNLRELGWIDNVPALIAASDIVAASAGDNTVHEIARVGRPFICVPEWRYFDEQTVKAERLEAVGAAAMCRTWPASTGQWRSAIERALALDLKRQTCLFDPMAARRGGQYIESLATKLWVRSVGSSAAPHPGPRSRAR